MKRIVLATVLASLVLASGASGADRVYWASFGDDEIHWANLDGSGGVQDVNTGSATVNEPIGLALDPVGGRVYWANHSGGRISWANLAGSGGGDLETGAATVSAPEGIAVDVAGRKVYWVNQAASKVSWANVDGSAGGDLDTGAAPIMTPLGLTLYPAAGRLYWANYGFLSGFISFANLDGSGGGSLSSIPGEMLDTPSGVAIDAAAARLYWTSTNDGVIYTANLDGSGAAELDDRGLEIKGPYGIALDTESGSAYVAPTNGESIMSVRLNGTGGASLPFEFEPDGANFPALLLTPRPRDAIGISYSKITRKPLARKKTRGKRPPAKLVGLDLSCSPGTWAPDQIEAQLYLAPTSTSIGWVLNRDELPGATSTTYRATQVGNYQCRETASNPAGSGPAKSSGIVSFFKVGGARLNRKAGTAKLSVELPPEGVLRVNGRGIASKRVTLAGKRRVPIQPKGRKKARLGSKGKVRVSVRLTFTPAGGPPLAQTVPVTLKKTIAP